MNENNSGMNEMNYGADQQPNQPSQQNQPNQSSEMNQQNPSNQPNPSGNDSAAYGAQEAQQAAEKMPQDGQNQRYPNYNFRQPEYGSYRGNYGYPPYQPIPRVKKEHPMLKSLGIFTAKAAIGSLIGAIIFGGTAFGIIKATNIDSSLAEIASEIGKNEESFDFDDNFPGFGGRNNSDFGNGGNNSSEDNSQQDDHTPKLGVSVTTVTDAMVQQGYPAGVMIAEITEGGDAANAGLQEGDIITAFDGTVVKSNSELAQLVQSSKFGKSVKVVYKRLENGAYTAKETTVTFTDKTASDNQASSDSNS